MCLRKFNIQTFSSNEAATLVNVKLRFSIVNTVALIASVDLNYAQGVEHSLKRMKTYRIAFCITDDGNKPVIADGPLGFKHGASVLHG